MIVCPIFYDPSIRIIFTFCGGPKLLNLICFKIKVLSIDVEPMNFSVTHILRGGINRTPDWSDINLLKSLFFVLNLWIIRLELYRVCILIIDKLNFFVLLLNLEGEDDEKQSSVRMLVEEGERAVICHTSRCYFDNIFCLNHSSWYLFGGRRCVKVIDLNDECL